MTDEKKCEHENTHLETKVVGQGVYRHMVRREVCDVCGRVVALW